jgi:transposase
MVCIPKHEYETLKALVEQLTQRVRELEEEIRFLKNGRKSGTSSTPPSNDLGRSNKRSLREPSGKKSGGQEGHPGHTLKMKANPDEIVKHEPPVCEACGAPLTEVKGETVERRQEVELRITPVWREHRREAKTCPCCDKVSAGSFPAHIRSSVHYGRGVKAFAGYLSVYQYLPYKRIAAMMREVCGIGMSEGTVDTIMEELRVHGEPAYKEIRKRLEESLVVGCDETGCRVMGKKHWFFIAQNDKATYLFHSAHRDYQTIAGEFQHGFQRGTVVSDCYAAQLKIPAKHHQICGVHLLRELKNFEGALGSEWAASMKEVIKEALEVKRGMSAADYNHPPPEVLAIEEATDRLLGVDSRGFHKKQKAFIERLKKHREKLYTYLYHEEVPPDNNGSERGIRNMKVKSKVSGQFRSSGGAQRFAVIRSVVDTAIKNGKQVFQVFSNLAFSPT